MTETADQPGSPAYAILNMADAYSTAGKIMGRQSAGKAFLTAVARTYAKGSVYGYGYGVKPGEEMRGLLAAAGFKGDFHWAQAPGLDVLPRLGALYVPSPMNLELGFARNMHGPASYSLFGVTHTLSSAIAMDCVAALAAAPFQPWDALICTSQAAASVVRRLQDEYRRWLAEHMGATRFNPIQTPVIPLGVNVADAETPAAERAAARRALKLADDEVVCLFTGRLAAHSKANPAPLYQGLEAAAKRTGKRLVCLEAGVYPNPHIRRSFQQAQAALAPSVRFLWANGEAAADYRRAWAAGDIFVSLSDNIQETFGLTPLEAMAAGMPVIVSDWNGYKDTVRDGIDGFRIPVLAPPPGGGRDLAASHAMELDSYDYFIGRSSLATVVDPKILAQRLGDLADSLDLRARMGAAGRARARSDFDWPVILRRYDELAAELGRIRTAAGPRPAQPWRSRPDPFALFGAHPTAAVGGPWRVSAKAEDAEAVRQMLALDVANYGLTTVTPSELVVEMHRLAATGEHTIGSLVEASGGGSPAKVRAIMWLAKFDLLQLTPPAG